MMILLLSTVIMVFPLNYYGVPMPSLYSRLSFCVEKGVWRLLRYEMMKKLCSLHPIYLLSLLVDWDWNKFAMKRKNFLPSFLAICLHNYYHHHANFICKIYVVLDQSFTKSQLYVEERPLWRQFPMVFFKVSISRT